MSAAQPIVDASQQSALRTEVQGAARRFKASWAELGKLLVRVRDEGAWEGWGFASFDQYCMKEVHIRKSTADKLLRSYSFLARHEPRVVETPEFEKQAPAFEVVEVLADAEERGQLSPDEYQSIRTSIWDADRSSSDLKREFVERFPKPESPRQTGQGSVDDLHLRRFAASGRKLAQDLSRSSRIPKAIADRAAALAEDLEELASGASGS